jgi:ATP-dependent RNA helicase DDX10/DBP4
MDGLGAVVISPTRELAVQTFNTLRDIGKYHSFSAGLVIGGKPLKEERDRLGRMNILIATPGRLLQHLDSTVGFESAGVKVLGKFPGRFLHLFQSAEADFQCLTKRIDC